VVPHPDPAVSTRVAGCGSISEDAAPVRGDAFWLTGVMEAAVRFSIDVEATDRSNENRFCPRADETSA
jgi:hypothetical protein